MPIRHIAIASALLMALGAASSVALQLEASRDETGRIKLTASAGCGLQRMPDSEVFYHLSRTPPDVIREPLEIGTAVTVDGKASMVVEGLPCGGHVFAVTAPGEALRISNESVFSVGCNGVASADVPGATRIESAEIQSVLPSGWISVRLRGTQFCQSVFLYEKSESEGVTAYAPSRNVDATRVRALMPPRARPATVTLTSSAGHGAVTFLVPEVDPDGFAVAYEASEIVAAGLDPGAYAVRWSGVFGDVMRDLNGDGIVRGGSSERAVVVEPLGGRFRFLARNDSTPFVQPFPAGVLQGPRDGLPTRLAMSSEQGILWMRPGVGVWRSNAAVTTTAIPIAGVPRPAFFLASGFAPVSADSPPAPDTFAPEDLIFQWEHQAFGLARVGDLLDDLASTPGLTLAVDDAPFETSASVAKFTVRMSAPSTTPVRVRYTTLELTARRSVDFVHTAGLLVFEPGEIEKLVDVALLPRTSATLDRVFVLRLHDAAGATPTWDRAFAFLDARTRRRAVRR